MPASSPHPQPRRGVATPTAGSTKLLSARRAPGRPCTAAMQVRRRCRRPRRGTRQRAATCAARQAAGGGLPTPPASPREAIPYIHPVSCPCPCIMHIPCMHHADTIAETMYAPCTDACGDHAETLRMPRIPPRPSQRSLAQAGACTMGATATPPTSPHPTSSSGPSLPPPSTTRRGRPRRRRRRRQRSRCQ